MMVKGGKQILLITGIAVVVYLLWPYKGLLIGLVAVTLYSIAAYHAAGMRRR